MCGVLILVIVTWVCEIGVNTINKNMSFAIDSIVLLSDVVVLKIIEYVFDFPKK